VEVHVDLGFQVIDLVAQIRDDFLGAALGIRLEFDEKVSGVGFGEFQAQGDAGAAGEALDLGGGLEQFFRFRAGSGCSR